MSSRLGLRVLGLQLEANRQPPIGHLTPNTLRRTFASILGVCRVDTRRAIALLGHTDLNSDPALRPRSA